MLDTIKLKLRRLTPGTGIAVLMIRGNVKVVRATSILKMREAGERVCRSKSKMRWELEEEPPLPRMKWVRKTPVMAGHSGARETVQICFMFDTKQVRHLSFSQPQLWSLRDCVEFSLPYPRSVANISA